MEQMTSKFDINTTGKFSYMITFIIAKTAGKYFIINKKSRRYKPLHTIMIHHAYLK